MREKKRWEEGREKGKKEEQPHQATGSLDGDWARMTCQLWERIGTKLWKSMVTKTSESYFRNQHQLFETWFSKSMFHFKGFMDIDERASNAYPKFSWIKTIQKLACILFYIIFRENVAFRKYIKLMTSSPEYRKFPFTLPGSLPRLGLPEPELYLDSQ